MIFSTLRFVVFKNVSEFFNFTFFDLFLNCYRTLAWTDFNRFLVKYKMFLYTSVLSDTILTILIQFFLKGYKVLDVINICCCCCLTLLYVLNHFLNNGRSHQSNAAFCNLCIVLFCDLLDDYFFIHQFS